METLKLILAGTIVGAIGILQGIFFLLCIVAGVSLFIAFFPWSLIALFLLR